MKRLKKIKYQHLYRRIELLNINHQIKIISMTKTNTIIKLTHLILKTIIETIIKQIIKKIEIVKIVKILKVVILFTRNRQIINVYSRFHRRRNKFFEANSISITRRKIKRLLKYLFRHITQIVSTKSKKKKFITIRKTRLKKSLKTL